MHALMHYATARSPVFGWLILGVWGGAVVGDAVAVMAVIDPGYVRSCVSAPTLLTFQLSGAFVGFCVALLLDGRTKQSPKTVLWAAWVLVSVGYWLLIRVPYESVAR